MHDEGTGSEPDVIRRLLNDAATKLDDSPEQAASEIEHALGLIGEYDSDYGGWLRQSWRWDKRWWICERCGTSYGKREDFRFPSTAHPTDNAHWIPTVFGSSSQLCYGRLVQLREVRDA
jgi:hypothetical protein